MLNCEDGSIDGNVTALYMAEEECLKKLPTTPVWRGREPNSYSDFGGETELVTRRPLSASRQNRKGSVVGVSASGGFNEDVTPGNMLWPLQGFFMADAREPATTQPLNAATIAIASVTSTTYTAAAGLGVFPPNALVFASGFTNAMNNGMKALTGSAAGALTVAGGLVAEGAPPAAAKVEQVGAQFGAGDIDISVTSNIASIVATAGDFTAAFPFLTPGMWLFIGGDAEANRFANNVGYARVASVSAKVMTFDDMTFAVQNEAGTGKSLRIFCGAMIRNEKDKALMKPRSYNIERQLGEGDVSTQAEYLEGAVANELTLNLPTKDKITVDLGYIAAKDTFRTGDANDALKPGARIEPKGDEVYNTSTGLYRIKLGLVDPLTSTPLNLFGYGTEATITIGNNVSANDALGIVGAYSMTLGNFDAGGTVTAYFNRVAAIKAIRNNADASINVIAASFNSGFVFDTPLVGLSGGRLNVEQDTPITIPITASGAENKNGYTMSYTNFPYLPNVAMPE